MNSALDRSNRPRVTPGRFLAALLVAEGLLLYFEPIRRLPRYDHSAWPAVSTLGVTAVGFAVLLLWFTVARVCRARFQFGLRSLVLIVLCAAAPLACVSREIHRARQREEAHNTIHKLGGTFASVIDVQSETTHPPGWVTAALGPELFHERFQPSIDFIGPHFTDDQSSLWLEFPQTNMVRIWKSPITSHGLRRLQELKDLQFVDIRDTPIGDEGVAELGRLSRLQMLELANVQMTDRGLAALGELADLRLLRVAGAPITDDGLAGLGRLDRLFRIELMRAPLTGRGFASLSAATHLRYIDLTDSRVNDEGLRAIARFSAVTTLDLSGTDVTDAGLECLASMTALETLVLARTKITDRGLLSLVAVPQLNRLQIADTRTTEEGCVRLKLRLPRCTIDRSDHFAEFESSLHPPPPPGLVK